MPVEAVREAYLRAAEGWRGCDWPTQFGETGLDLNGLKATQAHLMARATAGSEAADWRAAVHWLSQVEQEAKEAAEEARTAVALATSGQLKEAHDHARRACAIESKYHRHLVWQALLDATETALGE
jgi:hypothetical protein